MGKKRKSVSTATYSGRVALRLVKLRGDADLSVNEVVEKINKAGYEVAMSTYRSWENKGRSVPLDAIPAICKALKVRPRKFVPAR